MIRSSVENKVFLTKKITWETLQKDIEFLDQKQFPKDYFLWNIKPLLKTIENQIFKALKLFLKLVKTLENGRTFALESLNQNSPQMGFL